MTTLEIILICVIVWLIGMVVTLWTSSDIRGTENLLVLVWFISIPACSIYNNFFYHRKVPNNVKCGYDEDHAHVLKLPFGREKLVIYHNMYGRLSEWGKNSEKETFTEQDVTEYLKDWAELSKRQMRYIRRTKQITKITNKLNKYINEVNEK